MDPMMGLAILFSTMNVAVLLGLMYLYVRIARRSKAVYPVGLLLFASLLLVQNMLTAYSYVAMTPLFGESLVPYLFGISIFEFGGLVAFVKVTL